jgi:hypothetical protein
MAYERLIWALIRLRVVLWLQHCVWGCALVVARSSDDVRFSASLVALGFHGLSLVCVIL